MHQVMELLSIKRRLKVALYSVSLSVMELNALSQNSQVGTQIRPQEVDLNLAASGNPVEMAALAGVVLTRPALALAEKIWEFGGNLPPKVKVAILCILMVALIAACSSPAIATETVASSTPTTVSAPANLEPTSTKTPTKAPTKAPTKTPTTAPTAIPTKEIENYEPQTVECAGSVDFGISTDTNVEVGEGQIRKWSTFTLVNGEKVALVDIYENNQAGAMFYIFSATGSAGLKGRQADIGDLNQLWEGSMATLPFKGENQITILTGNKPEEYLLFSNPFLNILHGKLANQMIAFAKSGCSDTSLLPKFKGIPYPVLFSYRINYPTE